MNLVKDKNKEIEVLEHKLSMAVKANTFSRMGKKPSISHGEDISGEKGV